MNSKKTPKKTWAVKLYENIHPSDIRKATDAIMKSRSKVFEELAKY